MAKGFSKVLVVGAGPAGLLLALMLAQHDIQVDVVEALDGIDERPRGAGYGPAAVQVLRRAGVLEKLREKGLNPDSMTWRRLDGSEIGGLTGLNRRSEKGGFIMYPVHELARLLLEELYKCPSATVHWRHQVASVGQNETSAWVDFEGDTRLEADFVVGCDGATSTVRKTLFGRNFPGKTWDKILVATNILYDFDKFGWKDMSWIIDSENWAVVAHLSRDGMWRVSYGEVAGLSHEELKERMPEKLRLLLPGHPTPDEYQIGRFSPYSMHQRCAERMRVGRIMLAADAAHLCNPMGGLGLTTGIADVGGLVDCLYGIYDGKAGLDILDKYDQIRREVYNTVTDPISTTNLERVQKEVDSVANGKDPFFVILEAAKEDPNFYRQLERTDLSLGSDLTCFYDT